MKILHVIPTLDPVSGGPPAIAMRLATGQAGLGHEVALLSYAKPWEQVAIDASLRRIPGVDRVKLIPLPPFSRWERFFATRARRELRKIAGDYDLLYLHAVWDPIEKAAADAARAAGKPYFILINGMLDPWSLSQSAWKKKLALVMGYQKMLDDAAALHFGNVEEQELARPLGLKGRGVIIPNGIFPEEMQPLPAQGTFFSLHPELNGKPYILFLSRLHYKKGLDVLATAFALVAEANADIQLVVAGHDDGALADFQRRIAQAEAARAGIAARVHLVGPIYDEHKFAALVDATCFCLPSRQEGFSMAVTEAVGIGVPTVITVGCHFPEVQAAGAGYVTQLDAREIADAILKISNNPTLRQRMSAAGRELIASRYTWPEIARQSIQAYETR